MAVSNFKYCEITDVQQVYATIGQFDSKHPIYNFETTESHIITSSYP